MTQSMQQFLEQFFADAALSDQFKGISSTEEFANLAVQLGQKLGYSLTAEEVQAALAQYSASDSLSDAQLEAVAGGGADDYLFGERGGQLFWREM